MLVSVYVNLDSLGPFRFLVSAVVITGLGSGSSLPLDASSSSSVLLLDLVVLIIGSLGLRIRGS